MHSDVTKMLTEMCEGDRQAADRVVALLYDEIKAIAVEVMQQERADHTLQPTALVHEAFLRLRNLTQVQWRGRSHFCCIAAHVMRRVLIDHARRRLAAKRGGGDAVRVGLEIADVPGGPTNHYDLLELDDALNRLTRLQPRHALVVEMRYFAGLSIEDTARLLEISPTTVKADWRMARAWLQAQLHTDRQP